MKSQTRSTFINCPKIRWVNLILNALVWRAEKGHFLMKKLFCNLEPCIKFFYQSYCFFYVFFGYALNYSLS